MNVLLLRHSRGGGVMIKVFRVAARIVGAFYNINFGLLSPRRSPVVA